MSFESEELWMIRLILKRESLLAPEDVPAFMEEYEKRKAVYEGETKPLIERDVQRFLKEHKYPSILSACEGNRFDFPLESLGEEAVV